MAAKKKTTKKPQSTWQWYKSLSNSYKTLLFVLIFAVLGGGIAVYKSFAFAWTHVYDSPTLTVSACRVKTIVIGHGEPVEYQTRWAIRNGKSQDYNWIIQSPHSKFTESRTIDKGSTDWFRTTITDTAGTYTALWGGPKVADFQSFSVSPGGLIDCGSSK